MTNLITRNGCKLQLNGNRISGDTYPIKDALKQYCGAHDWDKATKSWAIDLDKLNQYMSIGNSIGLHIDNAAPAAKQQTTSRADGWCNKCQSWCYGDCTAH